MIIFPLINVFLLSLLMTKNMQVQVTDLPLISIAATKELSNKNIDGFVKVKSSMELPNRYLEAINCQAIPIGFGIPGFPPGVEKNQVLTMFGSPTKTLPGYWPNTNALVYDLIPDEVTLGLLFDKNTEKLRQSEIAFSQAVEREEMLQTLDSMLGCRLNQDIRIGFFQVWYGISPQYYFTLGAFEGIIERDNNNRIYIGIWQEDLH